MLPGAAPLSPPSAFLQVRQMAGDKSIKHRLLVHNPLRSQMTKMAAGYTANQLSFHMASVYLVHELSCMAYVLPGYIPG
jgi:hypothetical protein